MKTTVEIASRRSIRIAESVMSRMQKQNDERICLGCELPVPKGAKMKRGLCDTCSAAFYRHRDEEGELEKKLIQMGQLLPKRPAGRKPSNDFSRRLAEGSI